MSLSLPRDTSAKALSPLLERVREALTPITRWFVLRRDSDNLAIAYQALAKQVLDLSKLVASQNKRLQYYEQNIPRMRELRQQMFREEMGIKKKSNGSLILAHSVDD